MIKFYWEHWKKWPTNKSYKVSSTGHIKYKGKLLPEYIFNRYKVVIIDDEIIYIHRIVAQTYLHKQKQDGLTVDHIDANNKNNNIKNLALVSYLENARRNDFNNIRFDSISKQFICPGLSEEQLIRLYTKRLTKYGINLSQKKISKGIISVYDFNVKLSNLLSELIFDKNLYLLISKPVVNIKTKNLELKQILCRSSAEVLRKLYTEKIIHYSNKNNNDTIIEHLSKAIINNNTYCNCNWSIIPANI